MIIETITDGEIIHQLEKDLPEVSVKCSPLFVTSKNKNKWIVIYRSMSRNDRKHICYDHCTFVCTAAFFGGIYAFINSRMTTEGSKDVKLIVFQPHFFFPLQDAVFDPEIWY
jgi:hypothetical protein